MNGFLSRVAASVAGVMVVLCGVAVPALAQDAGGGVAANDTVESVPYVVGADSVVADNAVADSVVAEADAADTSQTEPSAIDSSSTDIPDAADASDTPEVGGASDTGAAAPASAMPTGISVEQPGVTRAGKSAAKSSTKPAPVVYSTPGDVPLPAAKFAGMRRALVFDHFPNPVSASTDPDQPGLHFWKHNTALMSESEDVTLEEAGSYIYYNDQWNLRVTFTPEEFAARFACPNALMKAGQPYTWNDNWRTDERLYGGWACYYAIGVTASGERVYGAGPIETTGHIYYREQKWTVNAASSSAGWTGSAEFNDFTIDGTLAVMSGSVIAKGTSVLRGEIIFDMASMASGVDGVVAHLMNADFFEVKTFPYAVFNLTEPVALSKSGGVARGQLRLKGVLKPVEVTFTELFIQDDEGVPARMIARGETTIDRTDFGVTFGSATFFPDAGEHAVADNIQFRFDLVLEQVAEGASANNSQ